MNFEVLSSDGATVYNVTVEINGEMVRAACTCKAGQLGKLCRHKIGILSGKTDSLVSKSDDVNSELNKFVSDIGDTACASYLTEMLAADAEMKEQKKRLDRAKRNLGKVLKQSL